MNDFYLVIGSIAVIIIGIAMLWYGLWKKDNEYKKRHDEYLEAMNAQALGEDDINNIRGVE